jgi:CRP-like cAMP-binding protein
MVSLVTTMSDGSTAEVATVGNEGIVGIEASLGGASMSNVTAIQEIPGETVVMDARTFSREASRPGRLREVVQGYARFLIAQSMQTGACNGLHTVEERIGRSLLLIRDRTSSDAFPLTQDLLSRLLGVTRPTVSAAAGILHRAGALQSHRGRITILDPAALRSAACEC